MTILSKRLWIMAAAVLLMSGCASTPGMKDWWTLREADFRSLRPGQSTQADVVRILGVPYEKMQFARQNEEVWDYMYPDSSFTMLAWVYFDAKGTYKYYTAQLHPAIYSSVGN